MNRVALGLAVGTGYLLGRTKKAKLALAVGSMVAGKKLNLGPRGIAELVNQQMVNNPQFKEIGDQLREELRGVGKAASGAMVERQMNALADRLHGRTAQVRDELAGVVPQPGGEEAEGEDAYPDEYEEREGREAEEETEPAGEAADRGEPARKEAAQERPPARKAPAKKAPGKKTAEKVSADTPAKKRPPAKKAPAKKAAAKKTAAGRPAAKKTAAAGDATRAARSRRPKGDGDR